MRVQPRKRGEFLQILQSKQATANLTNVSFYQDVNDTTVYHLIDEQPTPDAIERHVWSDQFSVLMGLLKVLCSESEKKHQIGTKQTGREI